MIPIGRGQRELIIGDRQTGKTAIAIDTIINQKYTHTEKAKKEASSRFIAFMSPSVKGSTVAQVVATLEENGCDGITRR